MAKVCSKTDSASSLAGVQLEGGCAPTFPDVEELLHSRSGAGHVGHLQALGSRTSAAINQTGSPASATSLKKCYQAVQAWSFRQI